MKYFFLIPVLYMLFLPFVLPAQSVNTAIVTGKINVAANDKIYQAIVALKNTSFQAKVNHSGTFTLKNIPYGSYTIVALCPDKKTFEQHLVVERPSIVIDFVLQDLEMTMKEIVITAKPESTFGLTHLNDIENFGIYNSKKNEVIVLKDMTINTSANSARQIYGKITGLNIWESDGGAGLQLGIGGRGLSPDRTTNFNTRQNGYDISADALGYPESYYSPPAEALERIEVVRGAASLQYGTQFGGMVNFVIKKGNEAQKINALSRITTGSWGFVNSFTSLSGQIGKLNYYGYFQHKQGDGFRQNSGFKSNNAFVTLNYQATSRFLIKLDLTKMNYLAQQAGGLTDRMFEQNTRQSIRNRNFFAVDWNLIAAHFTYKFSDQTQINIRNFALSAARESVGNLERVNVADMGQERTLLKGKFMNLGNEIRLIHRYGIGQGKNKNHTLLTGTRIYRGLTTAKQGNGTSGNNADFNYLNPNNLENSDYNFPSNNSAIFAENIFNISDKFSLTPGLRLENIQTFANGYFKQRVLDGAGNVIVETKTHENKTRKRSFLLAGIGASYKPREQTEFYGNISQNYRAINFTDLRIVNPNFFIDSNIQDEKGFTADIGVRGKQSEFFNYECTLFMLSYKGKIGQILKADLPPLFSDYRLRTNISDARNIGLELFGELSLTKILNKNRAKMLPFEWSVFSNLSLIDARYINTQETSIKNKKVEMVPPIMWKTGTTLRHQKFSGSVQFGYVGTHFSDATNAVRTASAVEGIIPAYQVADLSMSYQWTRVRLEASINNFLNEKYFTRRADFYPGPGIIPSDGRSFYLTLEVQMGKQK